MSPTAEEYLEDWEDLWSSEQKAEGEGRDEEEYYRYARRGKLERYADYLFSGLCQRTHSYAEKGLLISCSQGYLEDVVFGLSLIDKTRLLGTEDYGYTVLDLGLQLAAKRGDDRIAWLLHQQGADPTSALRRAIRDADLEMLNRLLKLGIQFAPDGWYLSCAFHDEQPLGSTYDEHAPWAITLIKMGIPVSEDEQDILWSACMAEDREMTRLLVERGADLDHDNGHIVRRLVEEGCDRMARYVIRLGARAGLTWALSSALMAGRWSMADYLLDHGADIHEEDDRLLREACEDGDLVRTQWLVRRGANIHAKLEGALRQACRDRHPAVVEYLVRRGADPSRAWRHPERRQRYAARYPVLQLTD